MRTAAVAALTSAAFVSAPSPSLAQTGPTTVAGLEAYISPRTVDDDRGLEFEIAHRAYGAADFTRTAPDDVVIQVSEDARRAVPTGATWSFLGAPGDPVWSTASVAANGAAATPPIPTFSVIGDQIIGGSARRMTLRGVTGPGEAYAYYLSLSSGAFSSFALNIYNATTADDTATFVANATNNRLVWSFTQPGYYCLDLDVQFTPGTTGVPVSARHRVAVAVGDVDPAQTPSCRLAYTPTTVALTSAPDAVGEPGTPVTLTARVAPTNVGGTVRFSDAGTPIGTPVRVTAGAATLTLPTPALGRHRFSAEFVPDDPELVESSVSPTLEYGVVTPGVRVFQGNDHIDVGGRLDDGGFRFQIRKSDRAGGGNVSWHDFDDSVVYLPDAARTSIPESPAPGIIDYAFLGAVGDPLWRIPAAGTAGIVWVGVSSEGIVDRDWQQFPQLRLDDVSGPDGAPAPGEVVGWQPESPSGVRPLFSTREGLPSAYTMPPAYGGHEHLFWDFSAPGVYCLGFTLSSRLADGTPASSRQLMTVVAGDAFDPYATEPCGRGDAAPTASEPVTPAPAPPGTHIVASEGRTRAEYDDLTPRLDGDALHVDLVRGDAAGAPVAYDLDDVIFQVGASRTGSILNADPASVTARAPWVGDVGQQTWEIPITAAGDNAAALGWNLLGIAPDRLDGDLTWKLKGVDGPGELVLYNRFSSAVTHEPVLSNRAGHSAETFALWPGRRDVGQWVFKQPGVHCVRLEWAGTLAADERPVSIEKTLTFVVGDRDPATVTPCGRGGHGDPPAGTDPGEDPDPDPNPVTDRSVLESGHVDVLSTVSDGRVSLLLKDGRDPQQIVHRALDEVVFSVPASARRTLPADPRFAFLGAAGATLWALPEVQDPSLLWPGWNSENDGSLAGADAFRWSLTAVRGPGTFALYDSGGEFGGPRVIFNSRDGLPDAWTFSEHAHGSWAFSAAGVYCLDMTTSATPSAGAPVSASGTLLVAVGVDPAHVTEDDCEPRDDPGPEPTPTPQPTPEPTATPLAQPSPTPQPETPPADLPAPATPVVRASSIAPLRAVQTVDSKRLVKLATLRCPAGRTCRVTAPRRVAVRIAGKRFVLSVIAPKTIRAGRSASVRVHLSKAALARLRGHRATLSLKLAISRQGQKATRTVRVTIKARGVRA